MHCYRVYTPLWLWYWPWVRNVLQRLTWGKKIFLHSKAVRKQGQRLSEQKPRRVQPGTQGTRTGSHAVGDLSEDLWKAWSAKLHSYRTCRGGHVRDMGFHAQKHGWARGVMWIAGCRRWSRYGESPRRRNVRDWGRWCWAAQESPAGCGCTRGFLCNKRADYEPNLKLSLLSHSTFT